eukprot:TRINITY_DN10448_c0_g1_i3.p1 TRINITY_DN10448_c0_g1~~TRINITY_DN10448_c0_g1_i3.p1  ORF type:complete len:777 (+),score=176.77 TRINITY_DN10448_c0_g1_i3:201-2531(+)
MDPLCEKCKYKQPIQRKESWKIDSTNPKNVALMHYARTDFDRKAGKPIKTNDRVTLMDDLAIPDTIGESAIWHLGAILVHQGNDPQYGHYLALIQHEKKWYQCDGPSITLFEMEQHRGLVESNFSLLVYVRNLDQTALDFSDASLAPILDIVSRNLKSQKQSRRISLGGPSNFNPFEIESISEFSKNGFWASGGIQEEIVSETNMDDPAIVPQRYRGTIGNIIEIWKSDFDFQNYAKWDSSLWDLIHASNWGARLLQLEKSSELIWTLEIYNLFYKLENLELISEISNPKIDRKAFKIDGDVVAPSISDSKLRPDRFKGLNSKWLLKNNNMYIRSEHKSTNGTTLIHQLQENKRSKSSKSDQEKLAILMQTAFQLQKYYLPDEKVDKPLSLALPYVVGIHTKGTQIDVYTMAINNGKTILYHFPTLDLKSLQDTKRFFAVNCLFAKNSRKFLESFLALGLKDVNAKPPPLLSEDQNRHKRKKSKSESKDKSGSSDVEKKTKKTTKPEKSSQNKILEAFSQVELLQEREDCLTYRGMNDARTHIICKIMPDNALSQNEAKVLSKVSSFEWAPRLIDVKYGSHEIAIIYEYIELGEQPRLKLFVLGCLEAVADLHRAGYVHGDLKASHLLVTSNGSVKLIDFGGATPINNISLPLYTPNYRAPEAEEDIYTEKLDSYSLGLALLNQILQIHLSESDLEQLRTLNTKSEILNWRNGLSASKKRKSEMMWTNDADFLPLFFHIRRLTIFNYVERPTVQEVLSEIRNSRHLVNLCNVSHDA